MKTILIPTDFSDNAENALLFAILLAQKENTKLVLHHSFQIPTPIAQIPYEILKEEKEDLRKGAELKLKTQAIKLEHAGLKNYLFNICEGSPGETIVAAAHEHQADMVIMGTKGANSVGDAFFGTNATYVMEHAGCPAMVIPASYNFNRPVKNITFATDYHESDLTDLASLLDFAKLFKAHVNVLHIGEGDIEPVDERELMSDFKNRVNSRITYPHLSFQVMYGEDAGEKLETYIAEDCADILVMSTHKRTFFERIFGTSTTRELALDTRIPIIAFHYNKKLSAKLN